MSSRAASTAISGRAASTAISGRAANTENDFVSNRQSEFPYFGKILIEIILKICYNVRYSLL